MFCFGSANHTESKNMWIMSMCSMWGMIQRYCFAEKKGSNNEGSEACMPLLVVNSSCTDIWTCDIPHSPQSSTTIHPPNKVGYFSLNFSHLFSCPVSATAALHQYFCLFCQSSIHPQALATGGLRYLLISPHYIFVNTAVERDEAVASMQNSIHILLLK